MKIYFIRHGQSEYNKDGRVAGQVDTVLTEDGKKEAESTAEELPQNFDLIFSSDLSRCKQTTEIINKKINLPIVYDVRLRERSFGSIEGTYWKNFDSILLEKDKLLEYDYRTFGGESVEDVKKRLLLCLDDIQKNHKNAKVLISTHGGIIRLLHHILKGKIPEKIHNASVHEFEFPNKN